MTRHDELAARNRAALGFLLFFAILIGLNGLVYWSDGTWPANNLFRWFGYIGIWLTAERLAKLTLRWAWPDPTRRPDEAAVQADLA